MSRTEAQSRMLLYVLLDHYMTGYCALANNCRISGFHKIGEVVSGHVMKE
jgi:hypothetical protein